MQLSLFTNMYVAKEKNGQSKINQKKKNPKDNNDC